MTSRDDLLGLADRVASGSGQDRELDAEVCIALQYAGSSVQLTGVCSSSVTQDLIAGRFPNGIITYKLTPALTSSIDAVEVLRERILPGSCVEVWQHDEKYVASLFPGIRSKPESGRIKPAYGQAPTEVRARLAALLRAYAATWQGR
ncbi:hypothetical protein [Labrys neptuniae]